MAKKRTTLVTKQVMQKLLPRDYLRYLTKVNRDIDKVDTIENLESTFNIVILGERLCTNFSIHVEQIINNKDGTMFIIGKN